MGAFRGLAKRAIERVLGSDAALSGARRRLRGARLVLSYHNVIAGNAAPSSGDAALHLAFADFCAQLDAIEASRMPVARSDEPAPSADAPPQLAITFDDAYAGALKLAVPELARRGMAATIFVAPNLLGTPTAWWDRLADAFGGGLPPAVRDRVLGAPLHGRSDRVLAAATSARWALRAPNEELRIGTESEVADALAAHPQLRLGAHTLSHVNVSELPAEELDVELTEPLRWLRSRWGDRVVPWMAYPYGLSSPEARARVARSGYAGAFLLRNEWQRASTDPHAIGRFNVSRGLSTMGFRARLAGLL